MATPAPLEDVLADVRSLVLDTSTLVRAVGAGRRRGGHLQWRRVELRPVDVRDGRRLQVTAYDERQAHSSNYVEADMAVAVDELLAQPFGNWHVETVDEVVQVRVTKKGDALVHRASRLTPIAPARGHDRAKARLFDITQPDVAAFLTAVGVMDSQGRIKPTKQDKYRQVEEFIRLLDVAVRDAVTAGQLIEPTAQTPWHLVDLGCGNAYLTVGAYVWLARVRGLAVNVHGIDVRPQSLAHNEDLSQSLGWSDHLTFSAATIASAAPAVDPDIVIALHACDTATDDALARAAGWKAAVVLASPCCHHDLQSQLPAQTDVPSPYGLLTRHGLLRERFGDLMTDAIRAALMRESGYRVDTVQFVSDEHTNRNLLLRCVRTDAVPPIQEREDLAALLSEWGLHPALQRLLQEHRSGG